MQGERLGLGGSSSAAALLADDEDWDMQKAIASSLGQDEARGLGHSSGGEHE